MSYIYVHIYVADIFTSLYLERLRNFYSSYTRADVSKVQEVDIIDETSFPKYLQFFEMIHLDPQLRTVRIFKDTLVVAFHIATQAHARPPLQYLHARQKQSIRGEFKRVYIVGKGKGKFNLFGTAIRIGGAELSRLSGVPRLGPNYENVWSTCSSCVRSRRYYRMRRPCILGFHRSKRELFRSLVMAREFLIYFADGLFLYAFSKKSALVERWYNFRGDWQSDRISPSVVFSFSSSSSAF